LPRLTKYIFLFALAFSNTGFAGDNPFLKHYGIPEGLLTQTIYHVSQDRQGFLWFSTDAGIVKYNGSIFRSFRKKDGLTDKEILRTQEDSQGRLWIFSFNGNLHFYSDNRIFNRENTGFLAEMSSREFFIGFFEDREGSLYFYNSHGLIYCLDKQNTVTKYDYPALGRLYYIVYASDGNILYITQQGMWISGEMRTHPVLYRPFEILNVFQGPENSYQVLTTVSGLIQFRGEKQQSVITNPLFNRKLITAFSDKNGLLWIGTFDQGVFCLEGNRTLLKLPIKQSQMIFGDRDKNIWITSMNDGIDKIQPGFTGIRHFPVSGFGGGEVTALYSKGQKAVWVSNGKSVYFYENGEIRHFYSHPGDLSIDIVAEFGSDLLIGKRNDMIYAVRILPETFTAVPGEPAVFNSFTKGLAVSNDRKELCLLHINNFFIYNANEPGVWKNITGNERIYSAYYNRDDRLILNMADIISTPAGGELEPFDELKDFFGKRIDDHAVISSEAEAFNIEGDSLWLVTGNRHINLTRRMNYQVSHPIIKLFYHFPHLYFTTRSRVFRIEVPANYTANKEIEVQTIEIEFSSLSDALIQNDTLFLTSKEGLTLISTSGFNPFGRSVLSPYFTLVQAKESKLDFAQGKEIVLKGNNSIHIDFDAINFSGSATVFKYKLDGLEDNWNSGTETSVVYKNLSPQTYTFRLRAGSFGSEWSNEVKLALNIKSALYQRKGFIIAGALTFAALIWFASRYYIRRLKKSQELKSKLITYEQKALQSMMNPHFIFNSLGSIQNYLLQNKADEASLYLSQFARLIRQNLNSANTPFILLEDETDRLMNYLSLERLRLDNKFDFRISIDPDIHSDEALIPSMVIQPFVENAVWHGISPMNDKGLISIQVKRESEKLLIVEVEDNGIGMKQSSQYFRKADHISIGMETTQKRLSLICRQQKLRFNIEFGEVDAGSTFPGTRVSFNIPFREPD